MGRLRLRFKRVAAEKCGVEYARRVGGREKREGLPLKTAHRNVEPHGSMIGEMPLEARAGAGRRPRARPPMPRATAPPREPPGVLIRWSARQRARREVAGRAATARCPREGRLEAAAEALAAQVAAQDSREQSSHERPSVHAHQRIAGGPCSPGGTATRREGKGEGSEKRAAPQRQTNAASSAFQPPRPAVFMRARNAVLKLHAKVKLQCPARRIVPDSQRRQWHVQVQATAKRSALFLPRPQILVRKKSSAAQARAVRNVAQKTGRGGVGLPLPSRRPAAQQWKQPRPGLVVKKVVAPVAAHPVLLLPAAQARKVAAAARCTLFQKEQAEVNRNRQQS